MSILRISEELVIGASLLDPGRRSWQRFLPLSVRVVAAIAAIVVFVPACGRGGPDAAGTCVLKAEPALVGNGGRAFAVGNRDTAEWSDVVVTVYGQQTGPGNRGQSTGAYTVKIDPLPSLKRRRIQLDELHASDGSRWQPLVMRPERVNVSATLRGETCRYESELR